MILVDANLLIYASVEHFPQHAAAKFWFESQLNGDRPVGLPWQSLSAFTRLITNSRMFSRPLGLGLAWEIVESWLALPKVWVPRETDDHHRIVRHLLPFAGNGGNLVPDLHLAAIAVAHGLTLCSTDSDFALFKPLAWQNPIA